MTPLRKVCIFCASSPGIDRVFFDDAAILGKILAENKIQVVYGGGKAGLMGQLADTILSYGGSITGVIPHFMTRMNWAHPGVPEMVGVDTMFERKALMIKDVDAVIALPGGVGTLEELMEVITLKQLGQFLAPIIVLNTNGFYDHLSAFLEKMIREKFIREMHSGIWQFVNSPHEVLGAIRNAPPWHGSAINFAAVGD
jgi:uncharacterized protein (TIGR00730 family)